MICLDTTVLIDEFRAKGRPEAPVNQVLLEHGSETLLVPVISFGEFLDGAAMISETRFQQSLEWLHSRRVVPVTTEIGQHYGRIVSSLRQQNALPGPSQNDLWIAATAKAHGARLMTRNIRHLNLIPGLELLEYGKG